MARRVAAALALVAATGGSVGAAEPPPLLLRASNASKAAIELIAPTCARTVGVDLRIAEYANNPAVAQAIAGGAPFDVVVIESRMAHDLARAGHVAQKGIRPLAALDMGLATREPGPDPRMDTVASFRRMLLNARSVGYVGDGHSGVLFLQVIDRLKIRAQLGDRLVPFTGAYEGAARESARLQYVAAPFSNPLPAPLRLVGKFPASLGADVRLSAGMARAAGPTAAAFLACLDGGAAHKVFRDKGYRLLPG